MPLFDFKCSACERVEEVLCSFKQVKNDVFICECQQGLIEKKSMEKQVSKANFKVWHYEAGAMDAEADMKKCGMEI